MTRSPDLLKSQRDTANDQHVRRRLLAVVSAAGINGVTSHAFRRTVAMVLDRAGGADLAAEMLEHHLVRHLQMHGFEPEGPGTP